MAMLLSELAKSLGLTLRGEDKAFTGLNTLDAASEQEVTFLANTKYLHSLAETKACAVIISEEYADRVATALISNNPYMDFARAGALFVRPQGALTGISPLAYISETAVIEEGCTIYPYAFIGPQVQVKQGCTIFPGVYVGERSIIGAKSILYPNAVLMADVLLGKECIIHSGVVLGAEGFGFIRLYGTVQKIPQIGSVIVGDNVEIGPNSCVDKSAVDATRIGKSTKIDNLVQVGHNVQVGEQCFLIAQVGIAGSTHVGNRVTMAGQAGIAGHLNIGDDVTIGPQSGVAKDIPSGTTGSGSPFMVGRHYLRSAVLATKLPEMSQRIQTLEHELAAIKESLKATKE